MRRHRQLVSLILAAVLLFCQAVLASATCSPSVPCAQLAFSPGHDKHCPHAKAMNRNVCLAHGTAADQSVDAGGTSAAMPALMPTEGLVVPEQEYNEHVASPGTAAEPAPSPPIPILFRNFRT